MKIKLILFFITFSILVSAQDSVYVFKMSKPKSYIHIFPNDSVLIKGKRYLVNIWVSKGKSAISRVKADSITVSRKSKTRFSIYIPKNTLATKTTLQIFEKKENGVIVLGKLKEYKLKSIPKPIIYVGGVKADSLIDKRLLYDYAKLEAKHKGWKIPVLSFEMTSFSGGVERKFKSNNNKLTVAMKHYIQRLEPGKILIFNNIKCLLPNGSIETVERIRLFFDETNLYKIGKRIINTGN